MGCSDCFDCIYHDEIMDASFNKKAGHLIDSTSLKAASQDSLNDVCATLATLISLCLSLVTDLPVDGVIGVIVSVVVLNLELKSLKIRLILCLERHRIRI